MGDRGQQVHSQLEHLQAKYVGTGHADTTKFDWAVNQHRDSYALYVGMDSLSMYFAIAENESVGRVKFSCLQVGAHAFDHGPPRPRSCPISHHLPLRAAQKMIQPCGPPPPKEDE